MRRGRSGIDPLFKEVGIYAALGQRYEPVDSDLVLSYREARDGQVLEEGITEAGSMASFTAAATAYSTQGVAMIPFYIFYSMFGFQRTGDQAWALGDARGRGFMMGATAGRTTLDGEGLQHDDGHSHLLASSMPSLRAYDPAYAYELAAVIRDGIERMYVRGRGRLSTTSRSTTRTTRWRPGRATSTTGIIRGIYRFAGPPDGVAGKGGRVRLVGSGAILQQVVEAQRILGRAVRRGGRGVQRALVPAAPPGRGRRRSLEPAPPGRRGAGAYVREVLGPDGGPVVIASDWLKAIPDLVRPWLPPGTVTLGTDGFGRSDTREALRGLFEIDGPSVAAAALAGLARCGAMPARKAVKGIADLGIDPDKTDPLAL